MTLNPLRGSGVPSEMWCVEVRDASSFESGSLWSFILVLWDILCLNTAKTLSLACFGCSHQVQSGEN